VWEAPPEDAAVGIVKLWRHEQLNITASSDLLFSKILVAGLMLGMER
jgi:hypothetical protein